MNFRAGALMPTVKRTFALLATQPASYLPPIVAATLLSLVADIIGTSASPPSPLGNIIYSLAWLAIAAWITGLALRQLETPVKTPSDMPVMGFFVLGLLTGLLTLLGLIFLLLPGLYLVGRFYVSAPALMAENLSPSDAMTRSSELTRQDWLAGSLLGILVTIAQLVPLSVAELVFVSTNNLWLQWGVRAMGSALSEAVRVASVVSAVALYSLCREDSDRPTEIFG